MGQYVTFAEIYRQSLVKIVTFVACYHMEQFYAVVVSARIDIWFGAMAVWIVSLLKLYVDVKPVSTVIYFSKSSIRNDGMLQKWKAMHTNKERNTLQPQNHLLKTQTGHFLSISRLYSLSTDVRELDRTRCVELDLRGFNERGASQSIAIAVFCKH